MLIDTCIMFFRRLDRFKLLSAESNSYKTTLKTARAGEKKKKHHT